MRDSRSEIVKPVSSSEFCLCQRRIFFDSCIWSSGKFPQPCAMSSVRVRVRIRVRVRVRIRVRVRVGIRIRVRVTLLPGAAVASITSPPFQTSLRI